MARGKRNKRAGKSKHRQSAVKDGYNEYADQSDEINEELTALAAIFQDDFNLLSENIRTEFKINLRPHTVDDELDDDYLSAELLVRYLPGYPLRPPKLQVTSKKGLTGEQLQYLHSMLVEQASSLAREGRVMIFNLTEAAQEFLSDQIRHVDPVEEQVHMKEGIVPSTKSTVDGSHGVEASTLVAGHDEQELEDSIYLDLFNNLWGEGDVQLEAARVSVSHDHLEPSRFSSPLREQRGIVEKTKVSKATGSNAFQESKSAVSVGGDLFNAPNTFLRGTKPVDLDEIAEETGDDSDNEQPAQIRRTHSASATELLRKVHSGLIAFRKSGKSSIDSDSSSTDDVIENAIEHGLAMYRDSTVSEKPGNDDVATQHLRKDLVLSYLLQLVCCSRGPLSNALTVLASELYSKGVLSPWAYNLVTLQPQLFLPTFRRMFGQMLKDTETTTASGQRAWIETGVGNVQKTLKGGSEDSEGSEFWLNQGSDSQKDSSLADSELGSAKFTNLEQPDRETNPIASTEVTSASFEGTGQVGTYFYTAPEVDQGLPHVDVKVDMYSLGVVFFELWTPFSTQMERFVTLNELKQHGNLPPNWSSPEFVQQATLVRWLMKSYGPDRPSAAQVLRSDLLPPRMENESLNDILRTIQNAEDTSVYDQIIAAVFDDERIAAKSGLIDIELAKLKRSNKDRTLLHVVGYQDHYIDSVKAVFLRHGAQRVESSSFNVLDDSRHLRRQVVKLIDSSGNVLDVRHEIRPSLARWVAVNQISSLKSYEISPVFRKGVGDDAPREYLQGDFDIIGGARTLVEVEAVKVAVEVVNKFSHWDAFEVRINHRQILSAIWNWTGVQSEHKQKVAQVLAMMGTASPQSPARKALWALVRRQLLQSLHIPEAVVDKLQTVERRLSGCANDVLPRLVGALPKIRIMKHVEMRLIMYKLTLMHSESSISTLMVHVHKSGTQNRNIPGACVAVGGRYDKLINRFWTNTVKNPPPGAVGLSVALQLLLDTTTAERGEGAPDVLVCSKGGGGLLEERMEIVNDLWAANIKAEYMCEEAPSLTEQYEYAHERGIKWLVIITEAALSLTESVKVRHLYFRAEEDVPREDLVKYFADIGATNVNFKRKASVMRTGS
ncbi:hypothetical protein AXG93_2116s1430 [Marchantia polymorpha subsp. ruderalis]|uniref:non-specific serine/threonine protein kinase n=1 Tax=Marchantia polymorpha subsp. ruderalis TaxID=1480154 RepID=A0A176VLT2_MARPO|nr:hypothetical protein AXG93_2116s1430 [Marchantia polymorpha subsp. ruderalis]